VAESIADDDVGPAALLEWGEPLVIAFYPDHAAKADLIARMHALAAPREVHVIRRGEDALPFVDCNVLVLVEPENEEAAVSFFDHNRDHFEDVKARLLLLLLRGGAGERALKDATALASFAREASFEVAPRPPRHQVQAAFVQSHGMDPEEWLRKWREGTLPDTLENNLTLSEALALTDSP
jgi:hypothetical protein